MNKIIEYVQSSAILFVNVKKYKDAKMTYKKM